MGKDCIRVNFYVCKFHSFLLYVLSVTFFYPNFLELDKYVYNFLVIFRLVLTHGQCVATQTETLPFKKDINKILGFCVEICINQLEGYIQTVREVKGRLDRVKNSHLI